MRSIALFWMLTGSVLLAACGGSTRAPPVVDAPERPASTAPSGPTRTDFKTIAKKLVSRCVAGGWIHKWRSTHEDPTVANDDPKAGAPSDSDSPVAPENTADYLLRLPLLGGRDGR